MDPGSAGLIGEAMFKGSVIAMAFMIMAYPFYRVIAMWFDRSLSSGEALIYLGVDLALSLGLIVSWGTFLSWLCLLGIIFSTLGVPLLDRISDKMALRRMEDDDIRDFTATLRQQPANVYLRERLARIFFSRQQYDFALAQLDQALETVPKDPQLTRLRELIVTERRRKTERLKVCPKCMHENPLGTSSCAHCGFMFIDPSDLLRAFWSEPALHACRWGGPGMILLGLVLLLVGLNLFFSGLLILSGATCLFWLLYVSLTRL